MGDDARRVISTLNIMDNEPRGKAKKMMTLRKNKKGMTGIETAIIVIAFVIAASVFAFAILNMGLLTTGKATQAITTGIGQAQSAMKVTSVYALGDTSSNTMAGIVLVVQPSGTGSTDFAVGKMSVSLSTTAESYANVYTNASTSKFVNQSTFYSASSGSFTNYSTTAGSSVNCAVIEMQGNGNQQLEQGEQFAVYISTANLLTHQLAPYGQFTVELIPSQGAKLTFSASLPATIEVSMVLTGS